jgi:hypothetical protein
MLIITPDNFKNKNLYRRELTEYDINLINLVIEHCLDRKIKGESTYASEIKKTIEKHPTYKELCNLLENPERDVVLAYIMLCFKNSHCAISVELYYVYGRLSPLESRTEWLDNFRLKAVLCILGLTKFQKDDVPGCNYSIPFNEPHPINKSVKINFKKAVTFLVGELKTLIIRRRIYPFYSKNTYNNTERDMSDEEICDDCYLHFPFFSGGCHGCDAFYINMTLTIEELTAFFKRYPSAIVGYILNTATYRSGKGEHWLSLLLTKQRATLICSQGSNFGVFHDNGRLREDLERHAYGLNYNMKTIQTDGYNCGLFSFLTVMMFLQNFSNHMDIQDIIRKCIDMIGRDGSSLKKGDIETLREGLVGVKQ